jgi:hypothetical protein
MRQGVMHMATMATGVAAGATTGGIGAAAGAAGGALTPGLFLRGLMHPWAQGYLGNQLLAGPINAVRDPRRPTERLISQTPTAPAQLTEGSPPQGNNRPRNAMRADGEPQNAMVSERVKEGATATNPETGERVIYVDGKWQPLQ